MNETKPLTQSFSIEVHYLVNFLFVVISLVAIVVNALVLSTIIRRRPLHTPVYILLSNLCIANIFAGLTIYPYVFVINVRQFNVSEGKERILCAFTDGNSLFFICTGTSLLVLCAISFTRHLTVKYPFSSKLRKCKGEVYTFNVLAWISMVILLVPSILSFKHSSEVGACVRDWRNINATAYRLVLVILTFFLPMTFLLLSYFALRRQVIKRTEFHGNNNSARRGSIRMSKKAEKVVRLLILNYLISWLPFLCYWILMAVSDVLRGKEVAVKRLQIVRIATLFTLLNCSLDPFLYMFGSTELRHEVKFQLRCISRGLRRKNSYRATAAVTFIQNSSISLEK